MKKLSLRALKGPVIMAAPMNGGINNPAFAAAVISNGGIAGFGFTYHTPQAIHKDISDTRALCSGPINANFFVFDKIKAPTSEALASAVDFLTNNLHIDKALIKLPTEPFTPNLSVQIEAVWQAKPEVLTFHFGIPDLSYFKEADRLGICTGVAATSMQQAHQIQDSGADFIIAQGIEAGGHRGVFNCTWTQVGTPETEGIDEQLSTLELVRCLTQPSSGIRIPVIAAGGIMTGQDIFAATQAGATGVQMGTAFLPCSESTASAAHKRYLLHHTDRGSAYTKAFSGRPAQGIRNEFMCAMESAPILDFPLQNTLTSQIRADAVRSDNGERQSLWAGSNYSQAAKRVSNNINATTAAAATATTQAAKGVADEVRYLSAGELMQQLRAEYQAAAMVKN